MKTLTDYTEWLGKTLELDPQLEHFHNFDMRGQNHSELCTQDQSEVERELYVGPISVSKVGNLIYIGHQFLHFGLEMKELKEQAFDLGLEKLNNEDFPITYTNPDRTIEMFARKSHETPMYIAEYTNGYSKADRERTSNPNNIRFENKSYLMITGSCPCGIDGVPEKYQGDVQKIREFEEKNGIESNPHFLSRLVSRRIVTREMHGLYSKLIDQNIPCVLSEKDAVPVFTNALAR